MDADQLKNELRDKVEGAYQTFDDAVESISPHAATLLRESNRHYLVIKGSDGRIFLRARLSLAFLYILAMLRMRELRWATLIGLPILLSQLQVTVEPLAGEMPDEKPLAERPDTPKRSKARANGATQR
jgi:hypothetical protein